MPANWFIGWPVAPGDWFDAVIADAPRGLRRFHPLDLHTTFVFLGPVAPEAAQAAWAAVAGLALPRFTAELGPVKPFGKPKEPSAFSIELQAPALCAWIGLHRAVIEAAAGARPDVWAPRPHVTVVRPTRRGGDAAREAGIQWAAGVSVPPRTLVLDRLALYTWSEGREDRLFRVVEERRGSS